MSDNPIVGGEAMQQVYAGTSGFSYKEWKGPFYPEGLPDKELLSYYSERLNAVEINNTFYRMPSREVLTGWSEQTPERFRFAIKASRRITHFKRLKDIEEPLSYLIKNSAVLGDKLGAVLFQLSPNFRCNLERLGQLLEQIPAGFPAVLEFRHVSWLDETVFALLSDHNVPMCFVDSDSEGGRDGNSEQNDTALPVTADWCYIRLRREDYPKSSLKRWSDFLAKSDLERSMLFFKHETAGTGPLLAESFLKSLARRKSLKVA